MRETERVSLCSIEWRMLEALLRDGVCWCCLDMAEYVGESWGAITLLTTHYLLLGGDLG